MIIERDTNLLTVKVATSVGSANPIAFGNYAGGILHIPAGAAAATLTFYTCATKDGTYQAIQAHDASVDLTAAITGGKDKELPPQLYSAAWLKIVASAINAGEDEWELSAAS